MTPIDILKNFDDNLNNGNIFVTMLDMLLWLIVWLLHTIVKLTENILDSVYTLGGLLEDEQVQFIVDALMPVAWAMMAIAIAVYAYQLISGSQIMKSQIFMNILLGISLMILLPWSITKLNNLTTDMYEYSKGMTTNESNSKTSLATQIVQRNTVDVVWLAKHGWKLDDKAQSNYINDENVGYIDPMEQLHPDGDMGTVDYKFDSNSKKVLGSYLQIDESGKVNVEEIQPFHLKFVGDIMLLSKYYYRYDINYFSTIIQLTVVGFAMLATSFKVVRLIAEIAFSKILTPLVVAVDLTTGQRVKELIKSILINYGALLLIPVAMQFYMVASYWVTLQDYNWLTTTVIMAGLAYFLIDGPEIVKKILGVDLGLQDGWRTMMGTIAAGTFAGKGVKAVGNTVSNGLNAGMDGAERLSNILSKDKQEKNSELNDRLEEEATNVSAMPVLDEVANESNVQDDRQEETYSTDINSASDEITNPNNVVTGVNTSDEVSAEGSVEDKERNITDVLQSDLFEPEDAERMINNNELDQAKLAGVLADDNISDENKQILISEIMNGQGNIDDKQRMINDILLGNDEQIADRQRNISDLVENNNLDDTTKQRMVNDILQGQSEVENKQRMINDILNNKDLTNESKQRMINDIVSADNNEAKQRIISELTNGQGDLSGKQRMVNEIMTGNNVDSDTKNRLIQELTNGTGSLENKQRMINDVMNNGSVGENTKRQLIENVMNNDSLSPEAKSQMLVSMTGGEMTEGKQRMIQDIVSGTATDSTRQQYVQEVLNGANEQASKHVNAVQNVLSNGSQDIQAKTQQITQMVNDRASDPVTQSRMINELVNSNENLSSKTQMINHMLQGNTTAPETQRQLIQQTVQSANIPLETKQAYINQAFTGGSMTPETKAQMIKGIFTSDFNENPESKTQQITQMVTGDGLNPQAKSVMVNELFNTSQNPMTNQRQQVVSQVLSSTDGISNKQQYVDQIFNKSNPVVEDRSAFVDEIRNSSLADSVKTQVIKQVSNPSYTSTPADLTQNINQVMNTQNISSGLKNNIINEISNPGSVYKTSLSNIDKKINQIDYMDM